MGEIYAAPIRHSWPTACRSRPHHGNRGSSPPARPRWSVRDILWKVASEMGKLDAVEKDLNGFKANLANPAVEQLLQNPSIPKSVKQEAVGKLMGKSGYADPTKNFFAILAENGRLSELENVIGKFSELQRAAKGEIECTVTVADELTAAQKKSLDASLQKAFGGGGKMSLDIVVKPEILGGLIVDVGDKHINMSILSRIQQLSQVLMQPISQNA